MRFIRRSSPSLPAARRVPLALRLALALFLAACTVGRALAADDTALRLANVGAANTSYVRIPNSAAFALQQFTVEAWVQRVGVGYGATTDGVGGAVVAKPAEGTVGSFLGSWYLCWNNSGQAFFSVTHTLATNGVTLQAPPVASPLARHHLAAVVSTDSVRLYVDGVPVGAAPWTLGTVYVGSNDVLIGACNFGSGFLRRLDGAIDDVRIWDHARSGAQIAQSMHCRLTGNEAGLVAYYRFDASSLADDSGHAHAGAAVGTTGALTYTALAPLSTCVTGVEPPVHATAPGLVVSPQPTRGPLRLRFTLPTAGRVAIAVYDVAGRRLATLAEGTYAPGEHAVDGDLSSAPGAPRTAGVRYVRLTWEGRTITRAVVVLP